jgi:hypothetical protein
MVEVRRGIIMIADITGYTTYLSESELEHANSVLRTLLNVLIENTRLPLIISRLQGDAVISYAIEGSFLLGVSMLEMVEACYIAYRQAIDLMLINTNCTCNACKNISKLDLKFFVHQGEFVLQPFSTYTELVGSDVNLIHRLMKNHVVQKTGYQAYALFTHAAIQTLSLAELAQDMAPIQESYEDIGTVDVFVKDMHPVWESRRQLRRIEVKEEEAVVIQEYDFPVSAVQLWSYLIKPEMRALFLGSQSAEVENPPGGRVGKGSVIICAHGSRITRQLIVDWQPFETQTIFEDGLGLPHNTTFKLSETENGSHLQVLYGQIHSKNPFKRWGGALFAKILLKTLGTKTATNFRKRIEEDLASSVLQAPEISQLDLVALRESMRAALEETQTITAL